MPSGLMLFIALLGHTIFGILIGVWVGQRGRRRFASVQRMLRQQADQLESSMLEARTDGLTGLTNRRGFNESYDRLVAKRGSEKPPVSLLMLDVDQFKKCNDEHGHEVGDEVLQGVATVLENELRDSDAIARIGGDEFAVILKQTELHDAATIAERVRHSIENRKIRVQETVARLTVSIGVAAVRAGTAETSESLFKRADQALYASKRAGRNQACFHDGDSCQQVPAISATNRPMSSAANASRGTCLPTNGPHRNGRQIKVPRQKQLMRFVEWDETSN